MLASVGVLLSLACIASAKSYVDTVEAIFKSIDGLEDIDNIDIAERTLKAYGFKVSRADLESTATLAKAHPEFAVSSLSFMGDARRANAPIMFEGETPEHLLPTLVGENALFLIDWLGGHEWSVLAFEDGQYHFGHTARPWGPWLQGGGTIMETDFIDEAHKMWTIEHLNPHHKIEDDLEHSLRIIRVHGGPSHREL